MIWVVGLSLKDEPETVRRRSVHAARKDHAGSIHSSYGPDGCLFQVELLWARDCLVAAFSGGGLGVVGNNHPARSLTSIDPQPHAGKPPVRTASACKWWRARQIEERLHEIAFR